MRLDWIGNVMGVTENATHQAGVDEEAAEFGDILQADFADTYWNLTLKDIVWMKYLVEECNGKKDLTVIKLDDDVVFDVTKLKNIILLHFERLQDNYYCLVWDYNRIKRNKKSKWYVFEKFL